MSYVPEKVKVAGVKKLTGDTVLLRLNRKMRHLPGQFAQLSLLGIGECPVSFCSYSRDYVEFMVRDVGSVTEHICKLNKGDCLWIRGPFGSGFPLKDSVGKNIVVIGGGTGVAPLRSVVQYVKQGYGFRGLQVFFGFNGYDDILFRDEFDLWKLSCDFKISLDNPCSHLHCFAGFVTELVKKSAIDRNSVAFICGPPVMTRFAAQSLIGKGLAEKDIFVSLERLMQCGTGKCGHCMINDKYVCKDGPVFNWSIAKQLRD